MANLTQYSIGYIKHLAESGDKLAQAILASSVDLNVVIGAEGKDTDGNDAANTRAVFCQLTDAIGNPFKGNERKVHVKLTAVGEGTPTGTVSQYGTRLKGDTTAEFWVTTNDSGQVNFNLACATAETVIVEITVDGGTTTIVTTTFAA